MYMMVSNINILNRLERKQSELNSMFIEIKKGNPHKKTT